jgi:hypothetical protein
MDYLADFQTGKPAKWLLAGVAGLVSGFMYQISVFSAPVQSAGLKGSELQLRHKPFKMNGALAPDTDAVYAVISGTRQQRWTKFGSISNCKRSALD